MAISYVNTQELDNVGSELVSLAQELEKKFTSLYNRLSSVPNVTKEWVGDKAVFYFNRVKEDKQSYMNFAQKIKDVGFMIKNNAAQIQNTINNNYKKES